jgi:hypothetical protein
VESFLPELFVFVAIPGVPAHNNLAERSVRPLVIARKISAGSRSPKGSQTRMGLASLFGTWISQGLNPFSQCLALLTQPNSLGEADAREEAVEDTRRQENTCVGLSFTLRS